nr:MAG: hypothetical protein [Bacteriophage sp.]
MNKYNKIVFVNGSAPALNADNLNHMDEGIERATDGAIALETEIATARGDSADLNTRFTADEASIEAVKSEIATARGGQNSLGARLDTVDTNLTKKADKTSTLAGYGITDAYTKEKTDQKLARKLDSMPFDSEPKNNSPCYLTSGAVYNALLVKADKTALSTKYDSSNIELGTATLTPYSTQIDKIKSATCLYEKIGDIVIVNVTVIMNATSLGGTSSISLLNMPFSNKSDVIVHDIGISKNGGMFRGSASKSAWLQFTPLNKQAYNFVADEQVNFSLIYKI